MSFPTFDEAAENIQSARNETRNRRPQCHHRCSLNSMTTTMIGRSGSRPLPRFGISVIYQRTKGRTRGKFSRRPAAPSEMKLSFISGSSSNFTMAKVDSLYSCKMVTRIRHIPPKLLTGNKLGHRREEEYKRVFYTQLQLKQKSAFKFRSWLENLWQASRPKPQRNECRPSSQNLWPIRLHSGSLSHCCTCCFFLLSKACVRYTFVSF